MPDERKSQAPSALPLVKAEIERFLASDKPEVLCIRGKWGVGKTYTWETILKECQVAKKVALSSYSYVSLFGLDSLERFKSSVFENVIPVSTVGTDPTIETMGTNLKEVAGLVAKAWKPGLGALAEHAAFLTVSKYIICVDDLERKGKQLRVIDILGLLSLLRERRKCKVVLILNEEELDEDDQKAFLKYSEKVIDSSLVYEPTAAEAASIALTGQTEHEKQLAERCVHLGISNIRILKKLERLVLTVAPELSKFDSRVIHQAVTSLALLGWCIYGHQDELLDFAQNKRYRSRFGLNKDGITEKEKEFDDFLENYGFALVDAFDRALLDGIKIGFFDFAKLKDEAKKLDAVFKDQETKELLDKPWAIYRDSFDDNQDEFVTSLLDVFSRKMPAVPLSTLDAGVAFLKRFGKAEEAMKAIDGYMKVNDRLPRSEFDLSNIFNPPQDPDVCAALRQKFDSFEDKREPAEVLLAIAKNSGWNDEDIVLLSKLSADNFYDMFKTLRGADLRRVVRRALDFITNQSDDPMYLRVGNNAYSALKKLGDETSFNAERVRNLYNLAAVERALTARLARKKAIAPAAGSENEVQAAEAQQDKPPEGGAPPKS